MKCNNCQAENAADALFCVSCGSKLAVVEDIGAVEDIETVEGDGTIEDFKAQSLDSHGSETQPVEPPKVSVSIPEEIVTPNVLEPITASDSLPQARAIESEPSTFDAAKVKKKSKLPNILIIILLIAAIGTAGYIFGKDRIMEMFKTPEERLVDGFFNSLDMRRGEIYTTFLIDDLELNTGDDEMDQMVEGILKDLQVGAMVRFDEKQRRFEGNLDLQLMGASLVGANYYVTEDYLILDIPLLYDEPLYWDLYEMLETVNENGSMLSMGYGMEDFSEPALDIDAVKESYDRYKDLFDRDVYDTYAELDWTEYKMIMLPYYEDHILNIDEGEFEMVFDSDVTFNGTQYTVEYDYLDNLEVSEEIIEAIVYDENVKAFVEEVITTFIGRIIETEDPIMYGIITERPLGEIIEWNSDYKDALEIKQGELIEAIDDMFDEMELSYIEAQDEASMSMDVSIEDLINAFDVEMVLGLDENGYLRSQAYEVEGSVDLGDSMGMMMPSGELIKHIEMKVVNEYNLINEDLDFDDIDKDDALDIGAMSEDELQAFMMEVQENIMATFMENPLFSDFLGFGF